LLTWLRRNTWPEISYPALLSLPATICTWLRKATRETEEVCKQASG